jgi:hypothetical protein
MNRESIRIIDALEASPQVDPWTLIKDLYGWDFIIGCKRDDFTNIEEVLLLLNKSEEEVL